MDEALREFLIESAENLHQMELDLVRLESEPGNGDILANIFRTIHTIKGTCGFLGFPTLEHVTHAGENLLAKLRDGRLSMNPEIASVLLALVDACRSMLASIEATGGDGESDYGDLVATLERLAAGTPGGGAPPPAAGPAPAPGGGSAGSEPASGGRKSRSRTGKAAKAAKPVAAEPDRGKEPEAQPPVPEQAPAGDQAAPRPALRGSSIRVDVNLLDRLMDMVGELVLARNQIVQISSGRDDPALGGAAQRLNHVTSELQEGVMKTRMQPIERVWSNFPRLVRDLSRSCDRQVSIAMEGTDTELDKSVIEAIKDPLTHLVRNAVDHGLEKPDVRVLRGKPPEGRITLRACHESGQVIIEVTDDGGGIDPERIRRRAVELGLLSAEQAGRMSEREALNLVFLPGLSTAAKVTSVSGRGVGLDVVSANVERIGGTVDVQSVLGQGTTITIRIPLTLAIVPALIVRCGSERFAIPQASLRELVRLEPGGRAVEMMHGAPVFRLREKLLPVVHLGHELGLVNGGKKNLFTVSGRSQFLVVLSSDGRQFGLIVDAVEDTQEIVVKPVGSYLKRIAVLAGATILGNGRVALILDVLGLAMRAHVVKAGRDRVVIESEAPVAAARDERQKLLYFRSRDDGRMAIPLDKVARLEEFSRSAVERAGNYDVVQYRGKVLPLFYVASLLPERRKRPRADEAVVEEETLQVVVYSDGGREVGLVVGGIVDIVEEPVAPQRPGSRWGVIGTVIIRDRVTELLDVPTIVASVDESLLGPVGQPGARKTLEEVMS